MVIIDGPWTAGHGPRAAVRPDPDDGARAATPAPPGAVRGRAGGATTRWCRARLDSTRGSARDQELTRSLRRPRGSARAAEAEFARCHRGEGPARRRGCRTVPRVHTSMTSRSDTEDYSQPVCSGTGHHCGWQQDLSPGGLLRDGWIRRVFWEIIRLAQEPPRWLSWRTFPVPCGRVPGNHSDRTSARTLAPTDRGRRRMERLTRKGRVPGCFMAAHGVAMALVLCALVGPGMARLPSAGAPHFGRPPRRRSSSCLPS